MNLGVTSSNLVGITTHPHEGLKSNLPVKQCDPRNRGREQMGNQKVASSDLTIRDKLITTLIGLPLTYGLAQLLGYLDEVEKSGEFGGLV